jgi:TonB family protein
MPESATQPQSDTSSDTQPTIGEPLLSSEPLLAGEPLLSPEPPPARWRLSKSTLLLIGGPIAGALLVWLAISTFAPNPATAPAAVAEQAAPEPAPVIETQPAVEASVPGSSEAQPEFAPEPVDPEPPQPQSVVPSAINEVIPAAPQSALDTIRGTVRVSVRVTIDNDGSVVDATAEDGGPSRYFERLAVDASRKWTFTPANLDEQRTMLVKFNFTREGVTAHAEPAEEPPAKD